MVGLKVRGRWGVWGLYQDRFPMGNQYSVLSTQYADPSEVPMHLLDLALSTPADNLALDEALLLEADAGTGKEVLRFWEWSAYAVVLGAGGKLTEDVDEEACRADDVPIVRRASGGGTVLLGPGCLCYSLVLSYDRDPILRDVNGSYRFILSRIATALDGLSRGIKQSGTSDLAAGVRKFSGNAQQRKKGFVLHHGTLLYGFDLARVARYLRLPVRQPEYRQRREHGDFLVNLPTTATELRRRLRDAWSATEKRDDWPAERVRQLVLEKYGQEEWIRRR
jgi:lipoate-protein ligase A